MTNQEDRRLSHLLFDRRERGSGLRSGGGGRAVADELDERGHRGKADAEDDGGGFRNSSHEIDLLVRTKGAKN